MCPARGSFDYARPESRSNPARPYRVLVVECGVHVRRLLHRGANGHALSVEAATDARQALRRLDRTFYDVVVVELPVRRAAPQELYRRVNEEDPRQADRLVFLTTDSLDTATLRFLSETGRPFVTRSVEPPELVELVVRVARQSPTD